jgi:peptidyl-prolyl cis-trans isomerase SDCCAG10
MSQVYASEPATAGRVIFETTHGPLEIQLWCRECPHTTRIFLQLCLDGFYDGIIVHRILPNTLLQCGALRSSNNSSQPLTAVDLDRSRADWQTYRKSIEADEGLERRQYELHTRLRFSHRGLVAMALPAVEEAGDTTGDDDLVQRQAQFFVTLEEAHHLDGKHVIFGTVAGPTIFNALRMGRIEVEEETGQPADLEDAPRIKSVKIVENPIHTDLVVQKKLPWSEKAEKVVKKKKKRKGKLDVNVLSFGDEVEEEAVPISRPSKKSKTESSRVREQDEEDSDTPELDSKVRKESSAKARYEGNLGRSVPVIPEPEEELRLSPVVADRPPKEERPKKVSAIEARRAKYAAGKRPGKKVRQEATMEKLMAFQSRVKETVVASKTSNGAEKKDNSLAARMSRRAAEETGPGDNGVEAYHGQVLEGKDHFDEKSSSWMASKFKCKRHIDHVAGEEVVGSDGRKSDDYKVVDARDAGNGEDDTQNDRRKHHKHSKKSHRK